MVAMVGLVLGVYQDVIYVDQNETVEILTEHLIHVTLEYGWGVDESIRHHEVLIVASRGDKCHLPLVPLTYSNEVVSTSEVELSEDLGSAKLFQGCWDERKG